MTIHDRDSFSAFVTGLPGVTLHEQWEALVAKVGGKVFCLLGDTNGGIVFKVGEIAFDGLTEMDGIGQAAYFAKRQW
ncbi:MmcQ/YjbR family DNA-binding protein [Devosia sp. ZB163]|uniref:MmcQ/YjbR family DNA-binding protein n=1 Tax=Devosia sp. ZB163 TaxID=3025938 RepID=UPI00235E7328|nr:MmcQ/YjbR family DNA-binding protein [Devosia sp. ZB163]MDC9822784.1 MmcQ/YjbR family DNA-binding protein [Devosia sp. ZB163]